MPPTSGKISFLLMDLSSRAELYLIQRSHSCKIWVAVKELQLIYYSKETLLSATYPEYANSISVPYQQPSATQKWMDLADLEQELATLAAAESAGSVVHVSGTSSVFSRLAGTILSSLHVRVYIGIRLFREAATTFKDFQRGA